MIHIIHIPLFYQTSFYPFPSTSDHPTTTATYIAIPSPSDAATAAKTSAVVQDARSWGWNVEARDSSRPNIRDWWAQYEKLAKSQRWDDDLWRIWQREHGIRILREDRALRDSVESSMSSMQLAVHRMKKAGRWARRSTFVRESTEWELRRCEERRMRLREGATRSNVLLHAPGSIVSLPGSIAERLENAAGERRARGPEVEEMSWGDGGGERDRQNERGEEGGGREGDRGMPATSNSRLKTFTDAPQYSSGL